MESEMKAVGRKSRKFVGGLQRRDHVMVKDIQFAYNNHQVINVLK